MYQTRLFYTKERKNICFFSSDTCLNPFNLQTMGRRKPGDAKPLLGSGNQPAVSGYGGQDEEGLADSAEEKRMNTPLSFGTKIAFGMG